MFRSQIAGVKQYFDANYYNVSMEWLEGCITWVMTEGNPADQTVPKLREFAYQQWLLGDLREMNPTGSLPPGLANQQSTILNGKYSVQVEQFIDIANSMYTQLKFWRDGVIDAGDAPDQNEADELSEWGKGPKDKTPSLKPRKLKLTICDGNQEIFGLEYRTIPSIVGRFLPGIKVQIIGPVECRRGVLFLEQKNFKILGGEIDTMLVKNAPENVIARKLQLEENPEPYANSEKTVPDPRREIKENPKILNLKPFTNKSSVSNRPARIPVNNIRPLPNQTRNNYNKPSTIVKPLINNIEDDDYDISSEDIMKIERETTTIISRNTMIQQDSSLEEDDLDDLLVNVDLEQIQSEALSQENRSNFSTRTTQLKTSSYQQQIEYHKPSFNSTSMASSSSSSIVNRTTQYNRINNQNEFPNFDDDGRFDDIDFNEFESSSTNRSNQSKYSGGDTKLSKTTSSSVKVNSYNVKSNSSTRNIPTFDDDFNDVDFETLESSISNTNQSSYCNKKPIINKAVSSNNNPGFDHDFDDIDFEDDFEPTKPIKLSKSTIETGSEFVDKNKPGTSYQNQRKNNFETSRQPLQPPTKKLKSIESDQKKPNLTGFLNKTVVSKPIPKRATMYDLPLYTIKELNEDENISDSVIVKAKIVNVTTKLQVEHGQWILKLKIGDNTGCLEVQFSDKVLEGLIGFSVQECEHLKTKAKENTEARLKVTEGIQGLKPKLMELNCYMIIEFLKDKLPCVKNLKENS